jgi:hypothetical protein
MTSRRMGEWRYSSTIIEVSGHFTPVEIAPDANWIGGWVGPRVSLDAVQKRNILPSRESNMGRPARRYTDWADS